MCRKLARSAHTSKIFRPSLVRENSLPIFRATGWKRSVLTVGLLLLSRSAPSPEAIAVSRTHWHHADREVQVAAAFALGRLTRQMRPFYTLAEATWRDPRQRGALWITMHLLRHAGETDRQAVQSLCAALHGPERWQAVSALAALGPTAEQRYPHVRALLLQHLTRVPARERASLLHALCRVSGVPEELCPPFHAWNDVATWGRAALRWALPKRPNSRGQGAAVRLP